VVFWLTNCLRPGWVGDVAQERFALPEVALPFPGWVGCACSCRCGPRLPGSTWRDKKQMVVVIDHDSRIIERRTFRCRAWDLGVALDWIGQCLRFLGRMETLGRSRTQVDLMGHDPEPAPR
jgi:hypothetical protein